MNDEMDDFGRIDGVREDVEIERVETDLRETPSAYNNGHEWRFDAGELDR